MELNAGGVVPPLRLDATFGKSDVIKVSSPLRSLRINRNTGLLTGSVLVDGKSRPFFGAALQNTNQAVGLFVNGNTTGAFILTPQ